MISTLTLNPALDRIVRLGRFERNVTNRVLASETVLGGKGTHVSINLACLRSPNRAFGVCHGEAGKKITGLLRAAGVEERFIHRPSPDSRTNYLIIEEAGDCTIIAEQGVTLEDGDLEDLLALIERHVMPGELFVLSGDASNCKAPLFQSRLMRRLRELGLKVLLDTSGSFLAQGVLEQPEMIKPNLDELSALCGRAVTPHDDDVIEAIRSLARHGIPLIAVSLGAKGSMLGTPHGYYRAVPPRVKVANTIGCGDSFMAGFAHGMAQGLDHEACLRLATAVSAATAESASSVGFDRDRALDLARQASVVKLESASRQ